MISAVIQKVYSVAKYKQTFTVAIGNFFNKIKCKLGGLVYKWPTVAHVLLAKYQMSDFLPEVDACLQILRNI